MFNSEKGIWIKHWLWKFYIQNVLHILSVIMIFPGFFSAYFFKHINVSSSTTFSV